MYKEMTIQIDEQIYDNISTQFDKQKISQFVENLFKNLLTLNQISSVAKVTEFDDLEQGYMAMAQDSEREQDAQAWANALVTDGKKDLVNEAW